MGRDCSFPLLPIPDGHSAGYYHRYPARMMMRPSWTNFLVYFLPLFARLAECTFLLDPIKSNKLVQLFLDQNLAIQLGVEQRNQTEVELFAISHGGEPIFRLSSSTIQNNLLVEFRMENGRRKRIAIDCPLPVPDDQLRKILLVLDDHKLRVAENCRQLYVSPAEDGDLKFSKIPPNELRVILAPNQPSLEFPNVNLREFSADETFQLESRCPHLETLIDNRIQVDFLPGEGGRTTASEMDGQLARSRKEDTGRGRKEEEGELLQRIEHLEGQMSHWTKLFGRFEGRIKRVELHQRGCLDPSGLLMGPGQRVQNFTDCSECQCGLDSILYCKPIGCPKLDCAHPVHSPGRCCPHCGKKCLHNGIHYESGQLFWPKQCTFCLCDDGKMQCGFRFPNNCPALDCLQQETPPNQCCPVCVNVDHCVEGRNPCSRNASCQSGTHSAICSCKEGFFGNGTICTDIDECLWDRDARKQLGGCGEGTLCINLPGSFKCECLPGYQKLDSRNCLDVIRI